MFGMLDYRAHKLLWLLTRPLALAALLTYAACIAFGIIIAEQFKYPPFARAVIAYVAFEAIGIVVYLLWKLIYWIVQTVFFWTIDVVPAEGRTREQAMEVAIGGPVVILAYKFNNDIDNWTLEDTDQLARRLTNWRARLFFKGKKRIGQRLYDIQRHCWQTGEKPQEISSDSMKKLVGHLDFNWFEIAIISPYFFKSILAAVVILTYYLLR